MHRYFKITRMAFLFIVILFSFAFSQETLTITTYYPSPSGSYNELGVNKLAVDINGVAVPSEYDAMSNGDAHIGRSLIVGAGGDSGFAYDEGATTADGSVLIKGSVGIGTTNPIATLTVGNNVSGLGLGGNTWVSLGLSGAKNTAGITMGSDTVSNRYLQMIWNDSSNYGIVTTSGSAQPLLLQTNGGRVGIGTTGPANKLHVYTTTNGDGITVDGTSNPAFAIGNSGIIKGYMALATEADKYVAGSAANDLIFRTEDGTNGKIMFATQAGNKMVMAMTRAGDVGIGTTDPQAGLHVVDKSIQVGNQISNLGSSDSWITAGVEVTDNRGWRSYGVKATGINAGVWGAVSIDPMSDFGGNNGALGYSYTPGGGAPWFSTGVYGKRVGIDPNNYAGYFEGQVNITDNTRISGGASIAGVKGLQMFYDADDIGWVVSDNGSADPLVATARLVLYGDPVQIGAGTAKNLFVTGGIVVGSPEANPGTGNILVRGDIITDVQTYPDYVFDSGYKLMPLRKLQEFIAEKKHLPNMPSAQEIKKEGVKIFEQNRLMLEKLEEAYLYIINLEERIAKLENAIDKKDSKVVPR